MARPKKGEEKHRSASLRFRVREEISAQLRVLAASRRVSIADVAEEALAVGLRQMARRTPPAASPESGTKRAR
jgi:predicted HicB family RNase H-like nuclease